MAENKFLAYHDQFQKLAAKPVKSKTATPGKVFDELVAQMNASGIPEAMTTIFVRPYTSLAEVKVVWVGYKEASESTEAVTRLDKEAGQLQFNHNGFLKFLDDCVLAKEKMNTRAGRSDFRTYRLFAFLSEISKLPIQYLAYMHVLREVGRAIEVSKCERARKQPTEEVDTEYMTLLWAFKELETRLALTAHKNIRSDYRIFWYEAEWIDGK